MNLFKVVALYKFVSLPNFKEIQKPLLKFCLNNEIKGTLLLAHEGINGTLSGTSEAIDALFQFFKNYPEFDNIDHKISFSQKNPFLRTKVKLKKEIVTIGIPEVDPNNAVGTYLNPKEWNQVISSPETILIDTRNNYEINIGTFKNAVNPNTETFREFPQYVEEHLLDKKEQPIAMCCTGGIRCEKATSYLKQLGFKKVYHLKGGILKYLEEIPENESLWEGECFVFDDRVSVDHKLDPGSYDQCFGCRHPLSEEEKNSPDYKKGVHCPKCYHTRTEDQKKRSAQRQKQIDIAKSRNEKHIGPQKVKS